MNPVQNGLKVWIDAADIKSDATLWKDRSGNNNNFSIIGVPKIVDNIAIFDTSWRALIQNLNFTNWTIEITARFVNGENNLNHFSIGSWEQNNWKYSMGKYQISIRDKTSPSNQLLWYKISDCDNMLRTYGVTFNSNKVQIFCNGEILTTFNSTNIPDIVNFYLGYKADQGNVVADVKSLKIYNRALEDYEILNNYNYEFWDRSKKEYVNNNNLPIIVNKLMNASNIKIANNKYGNRVQTVIDKIVEKADNVTKAINQEVINTDYSFKVGTGTNVDVSSDVQDGFSSIAIKGNMYQNLFNYPTEVKTGTYDSVSQEFVSNGDEWFYIGGTDMLKPNTTYTLLFLYKSTANQINIRFDNDRTIVNNSTIIKDFGDISSTNNFQQFKKTFTTFEKVAVSRLLIRKCYGGTVTIKYPVLLEGDWTNVSNNILPSYFEGIVGVGDKSKNLFNADSSIRANGNVTYLSHKNKIEVDYVGAFELFLNDLEPINLKKGTYTLSFETKTISGDGIALKVTKFNNRGLLIKHSSNSFQFTLDEDTEICIVCIRTGGQGRNELYNLQLEEGSVATEHQPYGKHKIEILSNGKNLINPKDVVVGYIQDNGIPNQSINDHTRLNGYIRISPNKLYRLYIDKRLQGRLFYYDSNFNFLSSSLSRDLASSPSKAVYLSFRFHNTENIPLEALNYELFEGQGDYTGEFTHYCQNKTQILLDEPLMRLPNGVCDEITKDGKLIRRVGKVVFDGSEDWSATGGNGHSTRNSFEITLSNNYNNTSINISGISNNFSHTMEVGIPSTDWSFRIRRTRTNGGTDYLLFTPSTNIVPYRNIQSWKQWLSQNPTTVYYELAKPVITDIIPPSVRIYKDGYLTFNTLVAPESTHLVQLNKSAQINNTLEQVQSLNKKVDALDIIYNSLISSTSNTLSNLNK